MDFATLGLLIVTIIGWGVWGYLQKIGISRIGAESSLLLNSSTTLSVVIAYLALTRRLQIPRSGSVIYPILGGASAAIGTIAFFTALRTTPVSIARPIAGLFVLVTAFLGFFFLGEALTLRQYAGVGLAMVAIILLSG